MVLLSLDEYGNFENIKDMPVFIAGVLYDDNGDSDDIEHERHRIADYYKRVIQAAQTRYRSENKDSASDEILALFTYPEALHCNNLNHNQNIVVKYVKEIINESLPEFLSSCSFRGKQISYIIPRQNLYKGRQGQYHLFVMLKGKDCISDLKNDSDNMINDDYASNLYYHMVSRVVNRLIFHNPIYTKKMPEIRLNISTRVSSGLNKPSDESKKKQYKSLGYENRGSVENTYFSLMNADIYRTLIAEEMLRCKGKDIRIPEFSVHPIKYQKEFENGFAYLADSICSCLGFRLTSENGTYINEINKRVGSLNPDNINLVFAYDKVDVFFGDAVEALEKGDLYSSLASVFDAGRFYDDYALFYKDRLFTLIINDIYKIGDMDALEDAVDSLRKTSIGNNLDNEKFKFIFDTLIEAINGKKGYTRDSVRMDRIRFKLWEAGISACSHTGDPSGAIGYYNKCIPLFRSAGAEAVIRLNNRLVVAMEDLFSLNMAEEQALRNTKYQEGISSVLDSITQDSCEQGDILKGKTISQYARVLAARRDAGAEKIFRKALEELKGHPTDYKITQSYLCHHYLDMAMHTGDTGYLDRYEAEAEDYFDGNRSPRDQLHYLNGLLNGREDVINRNYGYYVLVRGIYTCHAIKGYVISDGLWEDIKASDFVSDKAKAGSDSIYTHGHPWEITYKYLRMLAIKKEDYRYEAYLEEQACSCIGYKDRTIDALMMFGDIQLKAVMGDIPARDTGTRELAGYLRKNFVIFAEKEFSEDGGKRYMELQEIFTFMYQ